MQEEGGVHRWLLLGFLWKCLLGQKETLSPWQPIVFPTKLSPSVAECQRCQERVISGGFPGLGPGQPTTSPQQVREPRPFTHSFTHAFIQHTLPSCPEGPVSRGDAEIH